TVRILLFPFPYIFHRIFYILSPFLVLFFHAHLERLASSASSILPLKSLALHLHAFFSPHHRVASAPFSAVPSHSPQAPV
ncbi:hypothetical protein BDQ17DRAFT_1357382, partial [Cyathus striatus]